MAEPAPRAAAHEERLRGLGTLPDPARHADTPLIVEPKRFLTDARAVRVKRSPPDRERATMCSSTRGPRSNRSVTCPTMNTGRGGLARRCSCAAHSLTWRRYRARFHVAAYTDWIESTTVRSAPSMIASMIARSGSRQDVERVQKSIESLGRMRVCCAIPLPTRTGLCGRCGRAWPKPGGAEWTCDAGSPRSDQRPTHDAAPRTRASSPWHGHAGEAVGAIRESGWGVREAPAGRDQPVAGATTVSTSAFQAPQPPHRPSISERGAALLTDILCARLGMGSCEPARRNRGRRSSSGSVTGSSTMAASCRSTSRMHLRKAPREHPSDSGSSTIAGYAAQGPGAKLRIIAMGSQRLSGLVGYLHMIRCSQSRTRTFSNSSQRCRGSRLV